MFRFVQPAGVGVGVDRHAATNALPVVAQVLSPTLALCALLSLAAPRRESEWTQADWALQHSHPFASSSGTAADLYEQMPLLSVEVALDAVAFQVSFSSTVSAARVRVAPAIVFGDIPPHILVSTLIDVAAAHAGLGGRGRRLACSGW
jgi:hypothetical protein